MDLETVLALVREVHGDGAALRLACGHEPVIVAATGELVALRAGDVFHIRPELGETLDDGTDADGLALAREELDPLVGAIVDWLRRHEELAAFERERTRHPEGARHYFQPPGPDDARVRIAGRSRRPPWRGRDELRPIEPVEIAPGARLVAEHWRVGERVDPPDVLLALHYRVGDHLRVEARRAEAVIRRDSPREALIVDRAAGQFLTSLALEASLPRSVGA